MIEFHDVIFTCGEKSSQGLGDVSLCVHQGETVTLYGESGCGKNTTARLINGLIPHFYEGSLEDEALLDGRRVGDMRLYELSKRVGSVFQNPRTRFYDIGSTAELALGCKSPGIPPEEIGRKIAQAAERLALENLLDRSLFVMSGGEKQRIVCSSADTVQPDVMVLDGPSSDLDLFAIHNLARVVQRWYDDGKTLVVAEHRVLYLLNIADRFIYIRNGGIERELTPAELRELTSETSAELNLRTPESWKLKPSEPQGESTEAVQIGEFEYVTTGRRRLSTPELTLPRGEITAVLGRNGTGKATLVWNLCALEKHGRGVFEIGGIPYNARKRRELVYMVIQDVNHQLFTEGVISELLLNMDDSESEGSREWAREILQSLGLDGKVNRHPVSLSGGEKQRLAVGSAIVADKEVLILDEPTSGLNYRQMTGVTDALRAIRTNDKAVFVITHDIELVLKCCDHAIYLETGEITHSSRMDEDGIRYLRESFQWAGLRPPGQVEAVQRPAHRQPICGSEHPF